MAEPGARKTEILNALLGSRRVVVFVLPLARLLAGALALVAVAAAGLAGYWLSAGPQAVERLWPSAAAPAIVDSVIDMPEMIVNLRRDTPSRFLKIGLGLAVAPRDRGLVERAGPQLTDSLQEFLRNIDQDDLEGSAGLHRLRTEIKRRFNLILSEPNSQREIVTDVLLRSLLTQ
ncbi:flagellar basal body-associated FliL family protein [Azospirillum sp. TSO35-2]|uniref:flagellar basal body-associated FliL family protein n=1 Tax=Azospirillum sp. TSO35-2 TaxID=716796 RepID=UPI000D6047EA|nr:flagellar basal body-associated FliL family protein [Azospirillum sp. TSO35-2]PWC37811.1 flagellar basal body protein FliL [Azospirillum sp. TSO35-2]